MLIQWKSVDWDLRKEEFESKYLYGRISYSSPIYYNYDITKYNTKIAIQQMRRKEIKHIIYDSKPLAISPHPQKGTVQENN